MAVAEADGDALAAAGGGVEPVRTVPPPSLDLAPRSAIQSLLTELQPAITSLEREKEEAKKQKEQQKRAKAEEAARSRAAKAEEDKQKRLEKKLLAEKAALKKQQLRDENRKRAKLGLKPIKSMSELLPPKPAPKEEESSESEASVVNRDTDTEGEATEPEDLADDGVVVEVDEGDLAAEMARTKAEIARKAAMREEVERKQRDIAQAEAERLAEIERVEEAKREERETKPQVRFLFSLFLYYKCFYLTQGGISSKYLSFSLLFFSLCDASSAETTGRRTAAVVSRLLRPPLFIPGFLKFYQRSF